MAAAGLLLAGCRSDSFTAPNAVDCTGEPGCRTAASEPVDPAVYASLDDAELRLVPVIGDAATQSALAGDLRALAQALRDGRTSDARAALADVYVQIAPFRITGAADGMMDPPDVAALRLELVPAANALGVQVK